MKKTLSIVSMMENNSASRMKIDVIAFRNAICIILLIKTHFHHIRLLLQEIDSSTATPNISYHLPCRFSPRVLSHTCIFSPISCSGNKWASVYRIVVSTL